MSTVESLVFRNRNLALHRASDSKATLVLLHGYGADEHDLVGLYPNLPDDLDLICVRGSGRTPYGGAAWFDIGMEPDGSLIFNEDQAVVAAQSVAELITGMVSENLLRSRKIIIGGFSQGASIAMLTAALGINEFDGLMILSGRMTENLAQRLSSNSLREHFPVFAAHGVGDPVIPLSFGRAIQDFWSNQMVDFEYHEYEMGHQICMAELEHMNEWLGRFL
jgi:phospholipase/carboxylesterase